MTLPGSAIPEHYRRAKPVYEALATVSDYPTIGPKDFIGWYIKRDHEGGEAWNYRVPRLCNTLRMREEQT